MKLVTEPLETIVKSIDGVEARLFADTGRWRHGHGALSRWHQFRCGDPARARKDPREHGRIPVGVPEPLIVGRGIDDVAIVVLTLSPKPEPPHTGPPTG